MEELKREQAQQIADEHRNDAYSVALAMVDIEKQLSDARRVNADNLRAGIDSAMLALKKAAEGDYKDLGEPSIKLFEHGRDMVCFTGERLRKMKAEAVREAIESLHNQYPHLDGPHLGILEHYANKLENQND